MAANPVLTRMDAEPKAVSIPEESDEIITFRKRVGKWLHEVFSGHEEFLGCTPD
jgi:hypothetical protein